MEPEEYEVNRIDEAFENIRSSFTIDKQHQQLLDILEHLSNCNQHLCWCSKYRLLVKYQLMKCVKYLELYQDILPIFSTALVAHAVHCKNEHCNVYHCNDIRKSLITYNRNMQSEDQGTVAFSNTSWFELNDDVWISIDYRIFCSFYLARGAHGSVEYQWLRRNFSDVAIANKNAHYDFNRDILIAQLGTHPNVLSCQLAVKLKGDTLRSFIFMQKADCTLLEYTQKYAHEMKRPISPVVAVLFMKQILAAMEFLHQNYFIHGDIKGSNIVLTNGMQRLQLVDFSSVLRQSCAGHLVDLTNHFTCGYKPLETYGGPVEVLPALDIYSFGTVLLEMFFGEMAVRRRSLPVDLLHERNQSNIKQLRNAYPALASLAQCCVNRNPERRPSARNALEMITENVDELRDSSKNTTFIPRVEIRLPTRRTTEYGWVDYIDDFINKRMVSHMDMDSSISKNLPPRDPHTPAMDIFKNSGLYDNNPTGVS